jgi:2-phosphoglycerate kinase
MPQDERPEALLIGGRAGVGKTTAGWEVSAQLQAAQIAHAHVDGDIMDQIFPAPPGDPNRSQITEANLGALWRNYAEAGCRRLIYTNTVSVLEPDLITRAMGGTARIIAVLLTANDDTARQRLSAREIGSQLDAHLTRSAKMAVYLEATAPAWVHRIPTDGRSAIDVARDIITATGWSAQPAWNTSYEHKTKY